MLTHHRSLIEAVATKAGKRFGVSVYVKATCWNHLHLVIRGKTREGIQNFFRVFAGHVAQAILEEFPLSNAELQIDPSKCAKNQRKFWSYLIYSRVLSWGREFKRVMSYVRHNELEALGRIAYRPRSKKKTPS